MEIKIKKTIELSDKEIEEYVILFNKVFNLNSTVESFKDVYLHSCLGYSIHSLLYNDEGVFIGSYSFIPYYYKVKGDRKLFSLGSGLFIREDDRKNIDNLFSLVSTTMKFMKDNGYVLYLSFPNDESDIVSRVLIKQKRIGFLDTYILPYKVGVFKKSLSILNPFSIVLSKILLGLSGLSYNKDIQEYMIAFDRDVFYKWRYKRDYSNAYHIFNDNDFNAVWKISNFKGINACFLMDVYPMSKRNFDKAVREMVSAEKGKAGLFIYVGHLLFSPMSMIKIPRKLEPKKFRFDYKLLDKKQICKEDVENIDNWEVNLASYDLL